MAKGTTKSRSIRWDRFELTEAEIERQISEATRRGEAELRSEPLAVSERDDGCKVLNGIRPSRLRFRHESPVGRHRDQTLSKAEFVNRLH